MVQDWRGRKAIIYARVSTDDQKCSRQVEELREFAERLGVDLVDVLTETASGAKNDRPMRKKVLALAQARKIDAILVTEISRWGRSTEDLLHTLQVLSNRNVSVLSIQGMDFDMTSPDRKLMVTILAGISEFERALMLERVKSGIAHAKKKGTKSGKPFGRPKTEHADVVEIHLRQGLSVRAIAEKVGISKTTVMKIKTAAGL